MMTDTPNRPTPEQIEEWEARRAAADADTLIPYADAGRLRTETAEVAAQHDDLIAELMFETSMISIGA